jgi:hypothetical protein
MVTSTTLKLPGSLSIGNSTLRLEQDETSTLTFINGVQAGILAYEIYGKKAHLYDTDIILMVTERQNTLRYPLAFNTGFPVGYLSTLAQKKGVYSLTNDAFCEGYHEGMQAYCLLGRRQVFTLSEMCSLLTWKHRGKDSAFNAGYVAGFIQGFTEGIHAILAFVRGAREGKQ